LNLKQIAAHTGVSVSTVSRVLNGSAKISDDVRRRVLEAARELGYLDTRIRRAMQSTLQSILVAAPSNLLRPSETNFVSWTVMEALRAECEARDVRIEPVVSAGDRLDRNTVVAAIKSSDAEGVIVYFDENPEVLSAVAKLDRPVVLLFGLDPSMRVGSVGIGNAYGARLGVQYLLGLGHRRIALVTWPGRHTIRQRELGYRDAVAENAAIGAQEQFIRVSSFEPEVVERELSELLRRQGGLGDVTAIFCLADNIAIGVVRALSDFGISVPDDVSVLGFDDILAGQMMQPPLTTIHAPLREIGRTALDELELCLRNKRRSLATRRVELGCRLVERQSCAPLSRTGPSIFADGSRVQ
jgi:DNA-binding LacI/PurR family transcriptional regulator